MLFVDVVFARFVRENEYIERLEQCSMINYKCDEGFRVTDYENTIVIVTDANMQNNSPPPPPPLNAGTILNH